MSETTVNVLMVGTGEYTTGYVGGTAADSDKGAGVVALTMFDLRRRNKVDRVGMCGVNVCEKRRACFQYPPLRIITHSSHVRHSFYIGKKVSWYSKTHGTEYWKCVFRHGSYVRYVSW